MAECKEYADERDSDRESSQSEVYAFVDNDIADSTQPEIGIPKRHKKKKGKKGKKPITEKTSLKKKTDTKPPSPRTISSKSAFAQIAKELKARRQAQLAHAIVMSKKRKKNRVLRDEEIYTDKDRAAAVNMGTSDIKQSLKMKKKQDKNYDSQTLEEGDPTTLLALGNNELRSGDFKIALNFINKALELNPEDKNGLVARSKCYLSLGDPELALKDAETALNSDKTFVRGIYQKAEALYHLGDFEHSLMYYHRGHRLRPEQESFRLGVQKAQEAIENTIGSAAGMSRRKKTISSNCSSAKTESKSNEKGSSEKSSSENTTNRSSSSFKDEKKVRVRSKSATTTFKSLKGYFGELGADRSYLENLLKHPDLICCNQETANIIKTKAEEAITFLKNRQEFWRQQKPGNQSDGKNKEQRR